ncbi:MAG: DNA-3-methyladenine glycosylase [Acidimicrobiia bacterium]
MTTPSVPSGLLDGSVTDVARRLLGCSVATGEGDSEVVVRLTEVEAYDGPNDPASHAYRGRTKRNAPMYGAAGTVYVYLSYGIHWCMNITVAPVGTPSAVLLRGGDVVKGLDIAVERRGRTDHISDGPGKLCQALGVDGSFSGSALGERIGLTDADRPPNQAQILRTPRIGISQATNRMWRFVLASEASA